jgi:aminoglycoside phosphotransferase (APT) family kinase protein
VLACPGPAVLAHGDLHGDNQVWDGDELRLVVDFETAGTAEPEYDLRTFPGPGLGPGLELLTAVMGHYQQITGRQLSPTHRTPPGWVNDVAARFSALSIDP